MPRVDDSRPARPQVDSLLQEAPRRDARPGPPGPSKSTCSKLMRGRSNLESSRLLLAQKPIEEQSIARGLEDSEIFL